MAPFFISHPWSRLPCPASSSSACIKSVAASASIIFYTIFLSLVPTAASDLPSLFPLLSLSLRLQTVSVLFSVALHIFGAAHKFGCPSARSALSLGAFVKNHCCYSNFMEIPTLFLAFSFQRTDLRLRKICLSYASLRLILQKTKKPNRKRRGALGVAEKIIAGPAPVLQLAEPLPLRVARSCPAVGVQEHEKGRGGCGGR